MAAGETARLTAERRDHDTQEAEVNTSADSTGMGFGKRQSNVTNMKGRSAIRMFSHYPTLKTKPYWENHFWADGYCVDTVGVNEEMIRQYVRYQEKQERKMEQQRFRF